MLVYGLQQVDAHHFGDRKGFGVLRGIDVMPVEPNLVALGLQVVDRLARQEGFQIE